MYDAIVITAKTKRCLPYGIEKCTSTYDDWQLARAAYFEGNSAEIQECQTAASKLEVVQDEIRGLNGRIGLGVAILGELNSLRQTIEGRAEVVDFPNTMQAILK